MNVILVMIDTLIRKYLGPYGGEAHTPNFHRLAKKCVTMDNHWACSLPTLPTRHDVLAGRIEYLWRGWGPLEPFDITIPQLCENNGLVSQMITDTYHYFMGGAGNYHMDFTGWEFLRGHEADNWKTQPEDPRPIYEKMMREKGAKGARYMRNTNSFRDEKDFFSPRLLQLAAEWLDANHTHKNFFLLLDSFDCHEPFHVPPPYDKMYDPEYDEEFSIWSSYKFTAGMTEGELRELKHVRAQYLGKITMFDKWKGRMLDRMDALNLWKDTMLVVVSDHGYHFGEHGIYGKNIPPYYDILAHVPLFVWHPQMTLKPGSRSKMLTWQIDMYPTICEALGVKIPKDYEYHGDSLIPALKGREKKVHDIVHYGYYANPMVVTDGRYALHKMHTADNQPLCQYGLRLDGFHRRYSTEAYQQGEIGRWLPYTDCQAFKWALQKTPQLSKSGNQPTQKIAGDLLFDLRTGDHLEQDIMARRPDIARRLEKKLIEELNRVGAPKEQFERLRLK